jgi:hypothetical protein
VLVALALCLPGIAYAHEDQIAQEPQPTPTPAAAMPATGEGAANSAATRSATGTSLAADDFRDPASGWPNALVFDNYYIGYHEPEYYHVEVHASDDRAVAVLPGGVFGDVTVETSAFADAANTAVGGDFRFGLVVRREGSRYYAFAVSPSTQAWYALKSAPDSVTVLSQGTSAAILADGAANKLRIDAAGAQLGFYINDELVGEAQDAGYTEGAAGFYVETLDSPQAHVHFDNIHVKETQPPRAGCEVLVANLNVRSGPGTAYQPPLGVVAGGDRLTPDARNAEGTWVRVQVAGSTLAGWVSASPTYLACDASVTSLPVAAPPAQ